MRAEGEVNVDVQRRGKPTGGAFDPPCASMCAATYLPSRAHVHRAVSHVHRAVIYCISTQYLKILCTYTAV